MAEKTPNKDFFMTPPFTKGEEEQLEKLKRFSKDPKEIKKVRRKLQDAGYGDENAETNLSSSHNIIPDINSNAEINVLQPEEVDENVPGRTKSTSPVRKRNKLNSSDLVKSGPPLRRREDRPAFPHFKISFLKSLIALFTNISGFTQKYGKMHPLKISIINLLFHGCGFVLSHEVQIFINQTIFRWQETFKTLLLKIYKSGWRDTKGKPILSPFEFNLLQTASRLASDRGIFDTQQQLHDTKYIFSRVNPFIYCYYQLINAGVQNLLIAFKKGLKNISQEETRLKLFEQYDELKIKLIEFFDGRIEENFIIPLLESIAGHILEKDAMRVEAFIEPIEEEDYRADGQLKSRMTTKAKIYEKEFKKKISILSKELAFLDTVKQDLNHIYYTIEEKNYSAIALALAVSFKENIPSRTGDRTPEINKSKSAEKPNSAGTHIIKDIYYALSFFIDFYVALLTERIPVYGERGVEYIEIFNKNVFADNCKELTLLHKNLINYFQLNFTEVTTERPEKDYRKAKCLQLVEKICSLMYTIGKKTYKATSTAGQSKPAFKGLDLLNLGRFKIPFEERKLFSHISRSQGPLIASLHNKSIKEVMTEIRIFCFDFLRYFEPPMLSKSAIQHADAEIKNEPAETTKSLSQKPSIKKGGEQKVELSDKEDLFLDTIILSEEDENIPETENRLSSLNSESSAPNQTAAHPKTLLARLENYNDLKIAFDKLKNGEEISEIPVEY